MGNILGKRSRRENECFEDQNKTEGNVEANQVSGKKKRRSVRFSKSLDEKSSGPVTLNATRRPTTGNELKKKNLGKADSSEDSDRRDAKVHQNLDANLADNCAHEPQLHSKPEEKQKDIRHQKQIVDYDVELRDVESSDEETLEEGHVTIKSLETASIIAVRENGKEKLQLQKLIEDSSGRESVETMKQKFGKVLEEYKKITESEVAKTFQEACNEVPIFESLSPAQVFEIINGDTTKGENSLEMEVKRLQTAAHSTVDSKPSENQFVTRHEENEATAKFHQVRVRSSVDNQLQKRIEDVLGTRPVEFMNPVVKEKLIKVVEHHKSMAESEVAKAFQEACYELPVLRNLTPVQAFQIIQEDMSQNKDVPFDDAFNHLLERLQTVKTKNGFH